jgi:polysaccharide pyruvyl transferase WcaK-like protein
LNHIWEKPWHKHSVTIDRKKWKKVIGINVLSDIPDWVDRKHYIATMRSVVKQLIYEDYFLVFVPFQHRFNPRNDLAFTKEVFEDALKDKKNYVILEEVPIDEVSSYLQACDLFIGMRFHSLLLSTVNNVPFVAVAYDTKCWRFIEESNYRFALKLEDLEKEKLLRLCKDTLKHEAEIKDQLTDITEKMYAEAKEDIRALSL